MQDLTSQVNGTYAFTCVNNTVSSTVAKPTNTTYNFEIYLLNQIYSSDDDDYKDLITTQLFYWPYPTSEYLLKSVDASSDLTNTPPVRKCALVG